jgi:putative transposase
MDDIDRDAHEKHVAELVQRTGWEIHAWVLLDDQYNLVLRTPEPNLVAGMKWFQNFWSKRFNARHRRSGPVFGDRYKSIPVQKDGHLSALIDHVHLSAFRAGLASADHLAAHRWSSLKDYLSPSPVRRPWLRVAEGLAHMGYDGSDCDEQLRYLEHLQAIIARHEGRPPLPGEGRNLHSTFRRGWYLGQQSFRGELLAARSSSGRIAASGVHGAPMAQRILRAGLALGGLTYESLDEFRRNDWRKRAIGRAIRLRTTVPAEWISSNLGMGVPSRTAMLVARDPDPSWGKSWRMARELLDRLLDLSYDCAPGWVNEEPDPADERGEDAEGEACGPGSAGRGSGL